MSILVPRAETAVRVIALVVIGICTFLLIMEDGYSDDYMTGAIGVFNSGKKSHSESKFLNIGHRDPLGLGLTYQYEAGGWTDVAGQGRKGSAYGALQIGVQTDGDTFARVMAGPALITTPDSYLGIPFAFTEDFYIGLKGQNGNTVGFKYKHTSNAGISQVNTGRDFFGVEASIPW